MRIDVTQAHIDEARKILARPFTSRCLSCPIALAAIDAGVLNPSVDGYTLWYGTSRQYEASLPMKAGDFVFDFDTGEEVKPFSFEVAI